MTVDDRTSRTASTATLAMTSLFSIDHVERTSATRRACILVIIIIIIFNSAEIRVVKVKAQHLYSAKQAICQQLQRRCALQTGASVQRRPQSMPAHTDFGHCPCSRTRPQFVV